MTLTDQKGNIRGREFPTDTGIDGNACEETTKDQRWVGLCRQIPDTDTRPTSVFLSLSLSLFCSLSFLSSLFRFLALPPSLFLSSSFSLLVHSLSAPTRLTSRHHIHPSIHTIRSPHTCIAHNTHCHEPSPFTGTSYFHDGDTFRNYSLWKRSQRRTARHNILHSRPVVL